MEADIAKNLGALQREIATLAADAGRKTPPLLVAVCKRQGYEKIRAALKAGVRAFGENRVDEAKAHWRDGPGKYPEPELHFIGALQTNKTADAVALFDTIHSLDREKLARAIAAEAHNQGRAPGCFIQVNTGEEVQKSGIPPGEAVAFARFCRDELRLAITGMMCIPPVDEDPAMHFALLNTLATEAGLPGLSMGMSADYREAIALGATHIRIGTALFGKRQAG